MTHPGIELRISLQNGQTVLQMNSDMLAAQCGLKGWDNAERWSDILTVHNGIKIEGRAVDLPDLLPDTEDSEAEAAEPGLWGEVISANARLAPEQRGVVPTLGMFQDLTELCRELIDEVGRPIVVRSGVSGNIREFQDRLRHLTETPPF